RGHPVDLAHRRTMERLARLLSLSQHLLAAAARLGRIGRMGGRLARLSGRTVEAEPGDVGSCLRRRDVRAGQKRGDWVGKTKRGKGTRLVVVGSSTSFPLAQTVWSASPSATRMIEPTLDKLTAHPKRAVMDKE